ncbi:hypothetical protein D9613_002732 [Agrocybe pediades]|uniref:Mannosyltransferase n=1 Tax=Agrocybe pediades TaxID=84607 RepID=A0A8H4QQI8_9AGAR|nr:hypothetical protein D9613_002732 [Agrocybe pediades]KAF9564360.1 glycosyltransferase family 22 protein [Agrocybe pediades]
MNLATLSLIAFRVFIALCTRTFFQPDEFFQSLEPAHQFVFGYGVLTWEWMSSQPIRSFFYPALNVPVYSLLKYTRLSEAGWLGDWLLISLPKVVHGAFAALTDIYAGQIARQALGSNYVNTTIFLSCTSFFNALALSRSLSNSLETSLTTIAFAYYPWDASSRLSPQLLFNRSRLRKSIIFSALACSTRPTNAVIWVFLYANLFYALRNHRRIMLAVATDMVVTGLSAFTFIVALDSVYYGRLTITPLNFLKTNLSSVSLFYGANPWHYYITQALPILCTTALPFLLYTVWTTLTSKSTRNQPLKMMLAAIVWTIGVYSFAGHKEWRFIHPMLPLMHVLAAKSLVDSAPTPRPAQSKKAHGKSNPSFISRLITYFNLPRLPTAYISLLLCTLPASIYIVLFYCSGPVSILSYFRELPSDQFSNITIGVLMPCHSTPGFSYLHRPELSHGRLWSLGCEPPLENQDLHTYEDQTNVFFDSPKDYLLTYFPKSVDKSFPLSPMPSSIPGSPAPKVSVTQSGKLLYPWRHEWPQFLVLFGDLLLQEGVVQILEEKGYKEVAKAGRGWEGEGTRKGGARIWKWMSD